MHVVQSSTSLPVIRERFKNTPVSEIFPGHAFITVQFYYANVDFVITIIVILATLNKFRLTQTLL